MKKLKTGMKVHLEAGKGTLTILDEKTGPAEGRGSGPVEATSPVGGADYGEGSDWIKETSGMVEGVAEGGSGKEESSEVCCDGQGGQTLLLCLIYIYFYLTSTTC